MTSRAIIGVSSGGASNVGRVSGGERVVDTAAPLFSAGTFTSGYYSGPPSTGPIGGGTTVAVLELKSTLSGAFGVIGGRWASGWGQYLAEDLNPGSLSISGQIYGSVAARETPRILPFATDITRVAMVSLVHDGTTARAYLGPHEMQAGTANAGSATSPDSTAMFLGRWSGGNPSTHVGICKWAYSPTALTALQIRQLALAAMSRTTKCVLPALPGETFRWDAADAAATWAARTGTCTLTRTGTVPVAAVSTPFTWVQNAGTLIFGGNSTVVGVTGLTGGFRKPIEQAFASLGIHHRFDGPYLDSSPGMTYPGHRAVTSQKAADALLYGAGWAVDVGLVRAVAVLEDWGINDVGTGVYTPRQTITSKRALIQAAFGAAALGSSSLVISGNILITQNAGGLYGNRIAEMTQAAARVPGLCADTGAVFCDWGNPTRDPADFLHPVDGVNGFGVNTAGTCSGMAGQLFPILYRFGVVPGVA